MAANRTGLGPSTRGIVTLVTYSLAIIRIRPAFAKEGFVSSSFCELKLEKSSDDWEEH